MKFPATNADRKSFSLDHRQIILVISGFLTVMMLSFLTGAIFGHNLGVIDQNAPQLATSQPDADQNQKAGPEAPAPGETAASSPEAAPAPETPNPDGPSLTGANDQLLGRATPDPAQPRDDYIRALEDLKVPARADQAPAAAPSAPAVVKPGASPGDAPASSIATAAKAPVPAAKAPAAVAKAPAAVAPASPGQKYTIQLASFPDRGEADVLVKELRDKSYDAYMVESTVYDRGAYYRVRIGHYPNMELGQKALSIIQSREGRFLDAWVTQ